MSTNDLHENTPERRSEKRAEAERYYSVQFTAEGLVSLYQFKLWNISTKGMCILVKDDSEVLKHLSVGDTIEMTYYLADSQGAHETLKTMESEVVRNEEVIYAQAHYRSWPS